MIEMGTMVGGYENENERDVYIHLCIQLKKFSISHTHNHIQSI